METPTWGFPYEISKNNFAKRDHYQSISHQRVHPDSSNCTCSNTAPRLPGNVQKAKVEGPIPSDQVHLVHRKWNRKRLRKSSTSKHQLTDHQIPVTLAPGRMHIGIALSTIGKTPLKENAAQQGTIRLHLLKASVGKI